MRLNKLKTKKLKSLSLAEVLVVMVIIGVLTLLVFPRLMPLITKARGKEAETNLTHLKNLQRTFKMEKSKYAKTLEDLDFELDPSIAEDPENGTVYYEYEIVESSISSFTARATALVDFDDDGTLNVWEVSETGNAKEVTKD